jgi:hypothetical protein
MAASSSPATDVANRIAYVVMGAITAGTLLVRWLARRAG